jgi:putative ABC transport system permease protein
MSSSASKLLGTLASFHGTQGSLFPYQVREAARTFSRAEESAADEPMRMLIEIVRQSLATLWAHKLRSFLTMFGIAWGVGSLLLLVGLGEGFRSGQARQLKNLGQDIMFTFPGRIPGVEGSTQSGRTYRFTYQDYLAIRTQARSLKYLSPVLNREDIRAVSDYGSTNGQVFGVAPEYNQIRNVPVGTGRWFNDEDNRETRRVAVVGWELLKNIFPGRPAVGSTILLNGIRFDVIGVVSKVGQDGNNGTNARIFIPIETMRNLFRLKDQNSEDAISFLNYRPFAPAEHLAAKQEVHEILARQHGFNPKLEESFEDWDTIENNQRVARIFDGMDWFLGVVGVITLALGAIGIINIMLVSVSERTREIGLRKALGATHRAILTQFFVEGAFLTALSGGIGLGITSALVAVLAALPAPEGFDTPRIVLSSAVVAILSLAFAGIAAGLYPAQQAALLEPVEALRQE